MDYQKYLESLPDQTTRLQAVGALAFGFGLTELLKQNLIHPDQADQFDYLMRSERLILAVKVDSPFWPRPVPGLGGQVKGGFVIRQIMVEELALVLHEAGRRAVEAGKTVAQSQLGVKPQKFLEWDELTPESKEGRLIQAGYLLEHLNITRKE